MRKKNTIDLTTGSVTKKLLLFVLPIILTNILQHLYTAADRAVVGRFAEDGTTALAAVGSTGSAITLLLGLFTGMGVGVNVVCANFLGAKQQEALRRSMHTALPLAAVSGIFLMCGGILVAKPMLLMMNAPVEVIDLSTLYMRIYFCGVPASLMYNFGSAILRASGDTKRPMIILSVSGVVNVALNLVLVILFDMSVAGVAIATVVAQIISAVWVLMILFNPKDAFKMKVKQLRFHGAEAWNIVKIGVPCGFNGMAFSISNSILQATVNTFGPVVIAGNVAADGVGGLIYQVLVSFYAACVSFTGQNFGAKDFKRIDKGLLISCCCSVGAVLLLGALGTIFSRQFLEIFNADPAVVAAGTPKLMIYCWYYSAYAISEVFLGCLRGMRKTAIPSTINFLGICVSRVVWVWVFFPMNPTIGMVYLCWPISWILSAGGMVTYYFVCRKKLYAGKGLPAQI